VSRARAGKGEFRRSLFFASRLQCEIQLPILRSRVFGGHGFVRVGDHLTTLSASAHSASWSLEYHGFATQMPKKV